MMKGATRLCQEVHALRRTQAEYERKANTPHLKKMKQVLAACKKVQLSKD